MTNSDIAIRHLVQQHQSTLAHLKFLIHAVGKLDPQSCQGLADSTSLINRIALYRWSLYDFKQTVKRHNESDKRIFQGNRSIERSVKEHEGILEKIDGALELAEYVAKNITQKGMFREELNVYLVKIALAINTVCETIELHVTREEELIKQSQKTRMASGQ
jgi:hypothetical protein